MEKEIGSCWFIPCMRAINCTVYSLSYLEIFKVLLIKFIKIPLMSFPTFSWRRILLNMKWEIQIIEKMLLLGYLYLLVPMQGPQMLWTLPHNLMRLQTLHMNIYSLWNNIFLNFSSSFNNQHINSSTFNQNLCVGNP